MPGPKSSFSSHVAQGDQEPAKLAPGSRSPVPPILQALHPIPHRSDQAGCPRPLALDLSKQPASGSGHPPGHGGWPAVSSTMPEGLHHLVADSDTSPHSVMFQRLQDGRTRDTFIFSFASPFFPIFISWESSHPFYSSEFEGHQMKV